MDVVDNVSVQVWLWLTYHSGGDGDSGGCETSVPSAWFCCKPKTVLKNSKKETSDEKLTNALFPVLFLFWEGLRYRRIKVPFTYISKNINFHHFKLLQRKCSIPKKVSWVFFCCLKSITFQVENSTADDAGHSFKMQGNSGHPLKTHGIRHGAHAQKRPPLWERSPQRVPTGRTQVDFSPMTPRFERPPSPRQRWGDQRGGQGGAWGSRARPVIHGHDSALTGRAVCSATLVILLKAPLPAAPTTSILKTAETLVEATRGYRSADFLS